MRTALLLAAVATIATGSRLAAQCGPDSTALRPSVIGLPRPGSYADDQRRLLEIRGRCDTDGSLIRSASSIARLGSTGAAARFSLVAPTVELIRNSAISYSQNDGELWAGRGWSGLVSAGAALSAGPLLLVVAPELILEQNQPFFILPSRVEGKSEFASPLNTGPISADLPIRFGTESRRRFSLGQSVLQLTAGSVAAGFSTEEQWWGPGIRNALLLSNNAGGVPSAFVRTARPIRTVVGDVEARWIVGGLTESLYFDTLSANDVRSLSAAVATLRVRGDSGLTLGVARAVYANVASTGDIAGHAADVITTLGGGGDDPTADSDQILSLFGRWVLAQSGAEVYGEWARLDPPRSLRDALVTPHRTQGYTVGLQWVSAFGPDLFRLQAEASKLEQTPTEKGAYIPSFYRSAAVPQGYTHRGQSLGAAIGPGSSSQWLAFDYMPGTSSIGVTLGRIRWDDESFYRTQSAVSHFAHDVTLMWGVRGSMAAMGYRIGAEAARQRRLNFLHENYTGGFVPEAGMDINNFVLRLSLSPESVRIRR